MVKFIMNSEDKLKKKTCYHNVTICAKRSHFSQTRAELCFNRSGDAPNAKRTASDELASGQLGSESSPVTSLSHRNAQ